MPAGKGTIDVNTEVHTRALEFLKKDFQTLFCLFSHLLCLHISFSWDYPFSKFCLWSLPYETLLEMHILFFFVISTKLCHFMSRNLLLTYPMFSSKSRLTLKMWKKKWLIWRLKDAAEIELPISILESERWVKHISRVSNITLPIHHL